MIELTELVSTCGGTLHPPGDTPIAITRLASLDTERPAGALGFFLDERFRVQARTFQGACLVCREPLEGAAAQITWLHPNPRALRRALSRILNPGGSSEPIRHHAAVIAESAVVHASARVEAGVVIEEEACVGADARVRANAVIDRGASLGARSHIGPGAYIGPGCVIGEGARIGAGSVIGEPGFGFEPNDEGESVMIEHIGGVNIGARVSIGACCCVDAGTLDPTVIGDDTRLDNLVHIAHNVRIGERCWILGQVGVAGSTILEDDVVLAGQSGVAGHLRLRRGTRVAGRSGVVRSTRAESTLGGFPAVDIRSWRRTVVLNRRLEARLGELEARLEALESKGD